ncbi:phage holin, lambda family [Escherichia coli]|nr:phage holin, lambda family [Escherichia coli]
MKMPEKHDLLAAILAAKEQGIGAILAFAMAYLRGRYNGGAFTKTVIDATMCAIMNQAIMAHIVASFTKTVIDATMCAIIAWFIRDLLDFAGLSSNLAYITSVFIGYIGTDSIGSLIKRFAAKKAGVEDGGNQ